MALLDDIRAEEHGSGTRCRAGAFIAGLTDDQREAISRALEENIQYSAIGRWLVKLGFRYSFQSVARHLSGRCQCQVR